jgi:hypothetical protein
MRYVMSNDKEMLARLWELQTKVNMMISDGKREAKPLVDFLQGFMSKPARKWHEVGGVIYTQVVSDGKTGLEWADYFKSKGIFFGDDANRVLLSKDFKPTKGVITEIAILPGLLFESPDHRTNKLIRADASRRKLRALDIEIACLLRKKFTDKDIRAMGLSWIIAMHNPVKIDSGDPRLMHVSTVGGGDILETCTGSPSAKMARLAGFAFEVIPKRATRPFIG